MKRLYRHLQRKTQATIKWLRRDGDAPKTPGRATRRVLVAGLVGGVVACMGVTWEVLNYFFGPGTTICTYRGHKGSVYTLAWSPDGVHIASGGEDTQVQVWHVSTGETVFTYPGHCDVVHALSWSPDSIHVASGSDDETVRVWSIIDGAVKFASKTNQYCISEDDLAYNEVLAIEDNSTIYNTYAVSWSSNGKWIALGSGIWNATTGVDIIRDKNGYPFDNTSTYCYTTLSAFCLSWSNDSNYIAAGNDSGVYVWRATGATSGYTAPEELKGIVYGLAWSPDGRFIAAGLYNAVLVWNVSQGRTIVTYRGHTGTVRSVAWSPDGQHIASASEDTTVQIWEAKTGSLVFTYHGHAYQVWTVAWSPDGRYLASGSSDDSVQVWVAP